MYTVLESSCVCLFHCQGLTLSQTTNFRLFQTERVCRRLPNWKSVQTMNSNLMKMAEGSPNRWKILWEKEKLLVTSNFSFSHSVFKRLVLQTCKQQGLSGKGLKKMAKTPVKLVEQRNLSIYLYLSLWVDLYRCRMFFSSLVKCSRFISWFTKRFSRYTKSFTIKMSKISK